MVLAPVAFGGRRPCFTFINAKYFVNGGTNHPEQLPVLLARGLLSPHGTNPTVISEYRGESNKGRFQEH